MNLPSKKPYYKEITHSSMPRENREQEGNRHGRGGWLKKVFTGYFSALVAGGKTTGYLQERA